MFMIFYPRSKYFYHVVPLQNFSSSTQTRWLYPFEHFKEI